MRMLGFRSYIEALHKHTLLTLHFKREEEDKRGRCSQLSLARRERDQILASQ